MVIDIRPTTVAVAVTVARRYGLPPAPHATVVVGAFSAGSGLFLGVALTPIAVVCAVQPGQARKDSALEVRFVPLPTDGALAQRMLKVLIDTTKGVLIYYAGNSDSEEQRSPLISALEENGFIPHGQAGGGHVGFNICDAAGRILEFRSARATVAELGTRSVPAVAKLRPHWVPKYAPARVLYVLDRRGGS